MHADGSRVENGVEFFGAQGESRNGFASDGASEFAGLLFAAGADRDLRACAGESDGGSASGTSGAEKEDAALGEVELFFERAEDADVVGVRTGERAVGADDDGVDGADVGGEVVAMIEVFEDCLFVRDGDAEAAKAEVGDSFEKVGEAVDEEREIDGVDFFCGEGGIVEERGERVADGIADHAEDAGAAVELMRAVKMFEVVEVDLTGSGGCADGGVFESAAVLECKDAGGQADFAHGDGDAIF